MSEFHNAFYTTCKKHDIEHPKWRKCPKCEEVITYSEEEVINLMEKAINRGIQLKTDLKVIHKKDHIDKWIEQNKKK